MRSQAKCELGLRVWGKPEDLMTWIPEYELVIGMRFHALVLATKAGVAYVGWGNQSKVRQFCVDQSQPYWDFDRGWNADSVLRQGERCLGAPRLGCKSEAHRIDRAACRMRPGHHRREFVIPRRNR